MRRLSVALGVTALCAVASSASPAADPAFACRLRHPSASVASLAKLPAPIRNYIALHIGPMADRGEFFNSTDVVVRPGPATRFIRGGEIGERWFLWYEHGGIAYWRDIVLLNSDPSGTPHLIAELQPAPNADLCAQTDTLVDHAR